MRIGPKKKHGICTANKITIQVSQTKEIQQKEPLNETKSHATPNGPCLIIGDSIVTGIDQKHLSKKSKLVKVCDIRGATICDLKHCSVPILKIAPILKMKTTFIIIHAETNNENHEIRRQIPDNLLGLNQEIMQTFPDCKAIFYVFFSGL